MIIDTYNDAVVIILLELLLLVTRCITYVVVVQSC